MKALKYTLSIITILVVVTLIIIILHPKETPTSPQNSSTDYNSAYLEKYGNTPSQGKE